MQKVLLIEDDPIILRSYEKLFKKEGFQIELAENGQIGLDKISTYKPDIILLDLMMKDLNGLETIAKLKSGESTRHIPIVVLTNLADSNVTALASERGAVRILIKSEQEPDEVIGVIRGVLAQTGHSNIGVPLPSSPTEQQQ